MRIAYDNIIDSLTASAFTIVGSASGYSITAVQDQRLSKIWKSNATTAQSILIELPVMPIYPDGAAGITYFNDAFTTVDSWSVNYGCTLSVSNGKLVATGTGSAATISFYRAIAGNGKNLRLIFPYDSSIFAIRYYDGSAMVPVRTYYKDEDSFIVDTPMTISSYANVVFYLTYTSSAVAATKSIPIDWIYVGDSTYDYDIPDLSDNGDDFSGTGVIPVTDAPNNSSKSLMFHSSICTVVGTVTHNDLLDDRSIWFWYKSSTLPSATYGSIIGWVGAVSYSAGRCFFGRIRPTGVWAPNLYFGGSWDWTVSSDVNVCDGSWHFLSASFDRNSLMSVYVDGALKATQDISAAAAVNWLSGVINFGYKFDSSYYQQDGNFKVAGFGIANRVLTAAEFSKIYNGEKFISEDFSLASRWNIDEGYGVSIAAILGHNIYTDSIIKLMGDNTTNWTTPDLLQYMNANPNIILNFLDGTYFYRYWKIDIGNNPSVEIGRVWLGEYLQIEPSSLDKFTVVKKNNDLVYYSTDRAKFSSQGVNWRLIEMDFPKTSGDMLERIIEFIDFVGTHSSFIFCNFDSLLDYELVEPIYASLQTDVAFSSEKHMGFSYSLIMEEDK